MSDLIDRQAAIDALGEKPLAWTEGEYELGMQNQWQSDIDAIEALPSAQPDAVPVVHGKWIHRPGSWFHNDYQCSECGDYFDFNGLNAGRGDANYCPNCGARMDAERKE